MNIRDYLEKDDRYKSGYHYEISENKCIQLEPMILQNKGITCLKDFIQTNDLDLDNNRIKSLKGFSQQINNKHNKEFLSLFIANNKLKSLKGFNQKTALFAEENEIKSLKGFNQTCTLILGGNPINYIGNFKQKAKLDITLENIRDIKYWKGYNSRFRIERDIDSFIDLWKFNRKLDYYIKKANCILRPYK